MTRRHGPIPAGAVAGAVARRRDGAAALRWPQRGDRRRGHPWRQRRTGHPVSPLPERKRLAGSGFPRPDPAGADAARRRVVARSPDRGRGGIRAEIDRRGARHADRDDLAGAGPRPRAAADHADRTRRQPRGAHAARTDRPAVRGAVRRDLRQPASAAELGDVDRTTAIALLIGPLVLGRLSARCPISTTASVARRRRRLPARAARTGTQERHRSE